MHPEARDFVRRTVASLPPLVHICEFGSRDINGSIRELFRDAEEYVGLDLEAGLGVDVVACASTYGVSGTYDAVVSCEMLEHCDKAAAVCGNAHRLLRPGGVFIVTAAGLGRPAHSCQGEPLTPEHKQYYRNVTAGMIRRWLEPFEFVLVDDYSHQGDIYALAVRFS